MTHAFFKALLFLAAGIAIHALTGEQDIRKMRGLGRTMPRTRIVFLVGSLALVGIPPFAGFFSKDSILAAVLDRGAFGDVLFACGLAGAFLTGVYTFRLFFIVFGERGRSRETCTCTASAEGPLSMVWTVTVLAGALGRRRPAPVRADLDAADDWLVAGREAVRRGHRAGRRRSRRPRPSRSALAGIYVAHALYVATDDPRPARLARARAQVLLGRALRARFYRPADLVARLLGRFFELPVIAGSIGEVDSRLPLRRR